MVLADRPERIEGYAHAHNRADWLFVEPHGELILGHRYRLLIQWHGQPERERWPPKVGVVLEARAAHFP